MKRIMFLITLTALMLAACQPVPPAGSEQTEPPPDVLPTDPPETEEPAGVQFNFGDGNGDDQPLEIPTDLSWPTDPEAVILSATFCCGFVPQLVVMNYVSDATIFGDGRYIWVETDENGARQVFETQLTADQIESLLQQVATAGFFSWQDRYENPLVADAAEQCIEVRLLNQTKSVCEYFEGAPEAFHQLYDQLRQGAGHTGQPYTPERGYLKALPIQAEAQITAEEATLNWNTEAMGISLSKATAGVWLEGLALEQAWQVVNANPYNNVVQEGDQLYQLAVQIPGLSQAELPPAQ